MFTGLVEATAEVLRCDSAPGRLAVACPPDLAGDTRVGDSIAVDGACLTVTAADGRRLEFDLSPETARTVAGFRPGEHANIERALPATGRLGGHFVTGHVDGVATVLKTRDEGGSRRMRVSCPDGLLRHIVPKGSVTLAGVSLTVCEKFADGFDTQLVPHTLAATNLAKAGPGTRLNIETDLLAKHVEALLHRGE